MELGPIIFKEAENNLLFKVNSELSDYKHDKEKLWKGINSESSWPEFQIVASTASTLEEPSSILVNKIYKFDDKNAIYLNFSSNIIRFNIWVKICSYYCTKQEKMCMCVV